MTKFGNSEFSDKPTNYYNLDMIISVGYRVKSQQGIAFRKWATQVLKDYMIKGYAVNQRRLDYLEKTIKLIDIANRKERGSLPLPSTKQNLTLQQIGEKTTRDFSSNPEQASKAFETLETGVRTQEEIKEGQTQGEE